MSWWHHGGPHTYFLINKELECSQGYSLPHTTGPILDIICIEEVGLPLQIGTGQEPGVVDVLPIMVVVAQQRSC